MARRVAWVGYAFGAAVAGIFTEDVGAQDVTVDEVTATCAHGVISRLTINNRPVFDTDELREGSRLRGLYAFANALHVTTRRSFIQRELLFEEGECLDRRLLQESGRILRSHDFLDDARVESSQLADGSQHVTVTTRDKWSTQLDVGVAFDQGLQFERVALAEKNLLGRGVLAAVFMRRRREVRDLGLRLNEPRLFGTRVDASFSWGRTGVGGFLDQELLHPFVGEAGRWAFRQAYERREEAFAFSTGQVSGITHVLLPVKREHAELTLATRFGRPGRLTLLGFGLSRAKIGISPYTGGVEVAVDSDFASPQSAPNDVAHAAAGWIEPYGSSRINLLLGQRNLSFTRVAGLDALRGEQDVELGLDMGLTVGVGIADWTSGANDGDGQDLSGKLGLSVGDRIGSSFVFFDAAAEARRVAAGWRDVLAEADLLAYLRTSDISSQTFVVRISGSGGWANDSPFQLTLGGREAVRGLREEAYPGARRLLISVEDRVALDWPAPDYFDAGLTLFADAGRMWSGDVPHGIDSGWRGSAGFGIRFGFPAGTPRSARIDLAFPVGAGGGSPVLRVTMRELLGISWGARDAQLERSTVYRVDPNRFAPRPM